MMGTCARGVRPRQQALILYEARLRFHVTLTLPTASYSILVLALLCQPR